MSDSRTCRICNQPLSGEKELDPLLLRLPDWTPFCMTYLHAACMPVARQQERLESAAPELLAAASDVVDAFEDIGISGGPTQRLRAVIRQVRGE